MPKSIPQCPICLSKDNNCAFRDWNICRRCKAHFRDPMPTQYELAAIHAKSFVSPETSQMYATNEGLARGYVQLIAHECRIQEFRGVRVLDFGAGFGDVSAYLSTIGAEVIAIEPFGFEVCNDRGIRVYRTLEDMLEESLTDVYFDGVIMIEVLEHLSQPVPLLRRLRETLVGGGWLFLTTPNNAGAKARILRGSWKESQKNGHMILYSPQSVQKVLRLASFESILISRHPVRFSTDPSRHLLQEVLQIIGLGGNLKVIARK